jgi:hypothetical protein
MISMTLDGLKMQKCTCQQLEGCRVELINRGIDVYGCPAFLACQHWWLLVVCHVIIVDLLSCFWDSRAITKCLQKRVKVAE